MRFSKASDFGLPFPGPFISSTAFFSCALNSANCSSNFFDGFACLFIFCKQNLENGNNKQNKIVKNRKHIRKNGKKTKNKPKANRKQNIK
jgi:hypothetical protein